MCSLPTKAQEVYTPEMSALHFAQIYQKYVNNMLQMMYQVDLS